VGISIPLYEKNFTVVESITIIEVKIKMKMNEFLFVSLGETYPRNVVFNAAN
jgi:hypothetical protein